MGNGEPATELNPAKWDSYRAQLAYKLDLTKEKGWSRWLGLHQISGYDEYKYRINRRLSFRDGILDDHIWTRVPAGSSLNNNPNIARAFLRYYVGDNQGSNVDYGPTDFAPGTYPFVWGVYPATPNPPVAGSGTFKSEPSQLGLAASSTNTAGSSNSKTILKALGWVAQSHFLDERLVTTFGVRQDKQYQKPGYVGTGSPTSQVVNPDGTTFNYDVIDHWQAGDYKVQFRPDQAGRRGRAPISRPVVPRTPQAGRHGRTLAGRRVARAVAYRQQIR